MSVRVVSKTVGRVLLWIGSSALAGAALVVLTTTFGHMIFSALSPQSGYGALARPLLSADALDTVVPLLTGFSAAAVLLGACLMVRLPPVGAFVAMLTGFLGFVAWTIGVSGPDASMLRGALGVVLGGVAVLGIRRIVVSSARPAASA